MMALLSTEGVVDLHGHKTGKDVRFVYFYQFPNGTKIRVTQYKRMYLVHEEVVKSGYRKMVLLLRSGLVHKINALLDEYRRRPSARPQLKPLSPDPAFVGQLRSHSYEVRLERYLWVRRRLEDGYSFHEIGEALGLPPERVRIIRNSEPRMPKDEATPTDYRRNSRVVRGSFVRAYSFLNDKSYKELMAFAREEELTLVEALAFFWNKHHGT